MARFALPPYFHPTTICLVDDNQSFLRSLQRALPSDWPVQAFVDAPPAMAFLNRPTALAPLVDRCFALEQRGGDDAVIRFDLGLIEQEINHVERFERVSVAVIDYAMPTMDGLELCAALSDPYVQRAMLTGVADEKLAVQAFNEGLLERFSAKHRLSTAAEIFQFINEARHAYFDQHTGRLQSNLALDPPGFLLEPAVADAVWTLMEREQLVEYYLVMDPPGLLLLTAEGALKRLLVLSESERDGQCQMLTLAGANAAIIEPIARGERLGYFWDRPEDHFEAAPYPFADYLLPSWAIEGQQRWHLALSHDPPADINFDPARSSYEAFLSERRSH